MGNMNKAGRDRLAQFEKDEQERFQTELAEKGQLPADALTAISTAFETGHSAAVALAEAIDDHQVSLAEATTVALAETDSDVTVPEMPAALTNVDLNDQVIMSRDEFRDLLRQVALSEKPIIGVAQTKAVVGKPGTGELSLAEKLETASPSEAIALVEAAEKEAAARGESL